MSAALWVLIPSLYLLYGGAWANVAMQQVRSLPDERTRRQVAAVAFFLWPLIGAYLAVVHPLYHLFVPLTKEEK